MPVKFLGYLLLCLLPCAALAGPSIDSLQAVARNGAGAEQVKALLALAKVYQPTNPAKAHTYARRAFVFSRRLGSDTLQAQALYRTGLILSVQNDSLETVDAYYRQALAIFNRYRIPRWLARTHHGLGINAQAQHQYQRASQHFLVALDWYKAAKNFEGVTIMYTNLAIVFNRENDFVKEKYYQLQAVRWAGKLANKKQLAYSLHNQAAANIDLRNIETALQQLRQALRTLRRYPVNDTMLLAGVYTALGSCHYYSNRYDSAQAYLYKGLRALRSLRSMAISEPDSMRFAIVFNALGAVAAQQRKLAIGRSYLNNASRIYLRNRDTAQLAVVWGRLAELEAKAGHKADALHYVARINGMLPTIPSVEKSETLLSMAHVYAQAGNYAAAYRHRLQADSIQDSLFSKAKVQQIAELQARYELAQKEARIRRLSQAAAAQRAQAALQTRLRDALALGLLAAAVLGGMWYRRYRLQRAQARVLERAQARLRQLLDDKEVLLKEVHHRVKNNLQIISSMLALQSRQYRLPEVRAVVGEGQSWLQSIALVHEMLYRSDNLARVDMQAFLQQLTQLLTRGAGAPPVAHAIHAQGVQLNTDTAVPLGLIVNELLTNIYKHAFPGQRPGTVALRLAALPPADGDGAAAADAPAYELVVADDGVGLPEGFTLAGAVSLGLRLVTSLARQLGGEVRVSRLSPGTQYAISFRPLAGA